MEEPLGPYHSTPHISLHVEHRIKVEDGRWALLDGIWLWDRRKPLTLDRIPRQKIELLPKEDPRVHLASRRLAQFLLGSTLATSQPLGEDPGRGSFDFYAKFLPSSEDSHRLGGSEASALETLVNDVIQGKETKPLDSLVVKREEAVKLLGPSHPFIPNSEECLVLRMGQYAQALSPGPIPAGPTILHSMRILGMSSTEWPSSLPLPESTKLTSAQPVKRVHAAVFMDAKERHMWAEEEEMAKARDHRVIGARQELFLFHPHSPGSAFMLPHGTRIFHRLTESVRQAYHRLGYAEVMTPLLFHKSLWEQSGHWDNYRDDMYLLDEGKDQEAQVGLKPMNCPGHCLLYSSRPRSYRDLPLRYADFSSLHR